MISGDDSIVTVYARRAWGPGWSNRPLWIVVRDRAGKLREECLQPDQQSRDVHLLYNICEEVHEAMAAAVEAIAFPEG